MVTGDVDNSGYPDCLMVSWGQVVLWRDPWSSTSTQLQTPTNVLPGATTSGFQLLDHDGDGNLDILTGLHATSIAYGNGDGTFQPSAVWHAGGIGTLPATGDVNGDGLLDTIAAQGSSGFPGTNLTGEIRVSNATGPPTRTTLNFSIDGGRGSFTPVAAPGANGVAIGNLNDDGADDMLFMRGSSVGPSGIEMVLGSSSASFSQPQILPTPWLSNYQWWKLTDTGDVDGDGRMDLLLATDLGHTVVFGHPTLGLGAVVEIPSSYPAGIFRDVNARLADFDSDGHIDIASSTRDTTGAGSTGRLQLRRGLGNRQFGGEQITDWTFSGINYAALRHLAFEDFDQDGDLDFFLCVSNPAPQFDAHCLLVDNRSVLGEGCAGVAGVPASQNGAATPGNQNFAISITDAAPNTIGIALMSQGLAPSAMGCAILVDTSALIVPSGGYGFLQTDASGAASLPVPIPSGPTLLGLTLYTQWAAIDAASSFSAFGIPFAMSRARTNRIY